MTFSSELELYRQEEWQEVQLARPGGMSNVSVTKKRAPATAVTDNAENNGTGNDQEHH